MKYRIYLPLVLALSVLSTAEVCHHTDEEVQQCENMGYPRLACTSYSRVEDFAAYENCRNNGGSEVDCLGQGGSGSSAGSGGGDNQQSDPEP